MSPSRITHLEIFVNQYENFDVKREILLDILYNMIG